MEIQKFPILKKKFAKYYGFTDYEVKKLIQKYEISDTLAEDIKQWYNGYNVDNIEK